MIRHTSEGSSTRRDAATRRARTRPALLVLAVLLLAAPAGALRIGPGEAFQVDFGFSAPPRASSTTPDVLLFGLAPTTTSSGLVGYDVELWDGGALLATNSTGPELLWGFVAAGSAWTENAALVSDFSSIVDGTIDGRIRLIPQFGSAPASGPGAFVDLDFFPPPGTGMDVGVALADGISFVTALPEPSVSSTGVVSLPEPAVGLLLGAALLGAARRRPRS